MELADPRLRLGLHSDIYVLHRNKVLHLALELLGFLGGAESGGLAVSGAYDVGGGGEVLPELRLVRVELLHTLNLFKHCGYEAAHVPETLNEFRVLLLQLQIDLALLG